MGNLESEKITVQVDVNAPLEKVWQFWTEPSHIVQWNFASETWECPKAENDVRVGGTLKARMSAKDGSAGFDFEAVYTVVEKSKRLEFALGDARTVQIQFTPTANGTKVTETFEAEGTHPEEMQRAGWQAILDNFKKHVEALSP